MGKPPTQWPPVTFPYRPPQNWYVGEDSASGAPSWRAEGPLEPGKILTLAPAMFLEMANTALKVTVNAQGNDDGLQLFLDSPTGGCLADNVPNRFVGIRFLDQGIVAAVCSHSREGGSHNPGPHAWNISLVSPKKTRANVLIQAIYAHADGQIPAEYQYGYGIVSGPYCAGLCQIYGPHE